MRHVFIIDTELEVDPVVAINALIKRPLISSVHLCRPRSIKAKKGVEKRLRYFHEVGRTISISLLIEHAGELCFASGTRGICTIDFYLS